MMLGTSVRAGQEPKTLDGLYVGRYPRAFTAVVYDFRPSGLVIVNPHQMFESEAFLRWKKIQVPLGEDAPGKDDTFDLVAGQYTLGDGVIELRTLELKINLRLQILIYEEIWKELWEKEKVERKSFRFLSGRERIEIDGVAFILQKDQTGRKLAGEFAHEYRTLKMSHSGRAKFTADGGFAIDEEWLGSIGTGGANHGTGRYEVRGHDIILRYSDGRVETRLFGDLGVIDGKETFSMGHYLWVKDLFGR